MRIVVALGGRALYRRGVLPTADAQRASVRAAARAVAPLAPNHQLVISHGNGPQGELLVLQALVQGGAQGHSNVEILNTQVEDMAGYLFEQELSNLLPPEMPVAAILNMVEVDPQDPAFRKPTRFVGPAYSKDEADHLALRKGWAFKRDGEVWRRVVPSPKPGHIFEIRSIKSLLENSTVVICLGGGGILAMYDHNHERALVGVDAIVEKDSANALLARQLDADLLLFVTDVEGVYLDWDTPSARLLKDTTPSEIGRYEFEAGSMGAKVRAACDFVRASGGTAAIGAVSDIHKMMVGEAGTIIKPG